MKKMYTGLQKLIKPLIYSQENKVRENRNKILINTNLEISKLKIEKIEELISRMIYTQIDKPISIEETEIVRKLVPHTRKRTSLSFTENFL